MRKKTDMFLEQHELDHFDGVLFYDHFNKNNPKAPLPNAMIVE